jgi:hypothetical protein
VWSRSIETGCACPTNPKYSQPDATPPDHFQMGDRISFWLKSAAKLEDKILSLKDGCSNIDDFGCILAIFFQLLCRLNHPIGANSGCGPLKTMG